MNLARKIDTLAQNKAGYTALGSLGFDNAKTDERLRRRFSKLRGVNRLQKSIVKQNMHNAMSPLSAISGYLELINMSTETSDASDKISFYREQIEQGINEVNSILEQLHELYSDETDTTDHEDDISVDVDMNWLVKEVLRTVNMHSESFNLILEDYPMYVSVDMFIAKLILFELINYAKKCTGKNSDMTIQTVQHGKNAQFCIEFETSENKKREISELIMFDKEKGEVSNSFNEGLKNSKDLALQLGAELNFISVKEGSAMLSLSLPINY